MIKNAHNKYALQFIGLGDNPSKEELLRLINAIHAAIREGELTKETCDPKIVEKMQRVIIYALTDGKDFSFYRDLYFPPVPSKAQSSKVQSSKVKTKVKTKPKVKTKVKAKPKAKTKAKVQTTKIFSLKPNVQTIQQKNTSELPPSTAPVSEEGLKPKTEVRCMVYDVLEKPKDFNTNTLTNVTTNSTTKSAKPSNRQGVKIRSAKSIAQQQYNLFKAGAFGEVFGEVAVPFSLMVSGVPGSGKTSFLLQLIKHVSKTYARHRLLFVSNEERFNPSLGTKLKRFDMLECDNLDIADSLPSNLTDYDFIFLDSVQSLRLSVEDFKQQINQLTSAGICLFFVFQATKSGSFRGSLEYEHEVDISLKVEGGRATVGKNRFGGSGYYQIF